MKHGSWGYTAGCRCQLCTDGWAVRSLRRTRERHAWTQSQGLPASVAHGYSAYSNWGCHCVVCREANAAYRRRLRTTGPKLDTL